MPKIQIKETDKTGRVQATAISNVVFLPIDVSQFVDAQELVKVFKPTLFSSVADFNKFLTDKGINVSKPTAAATPELSIWQNIGYKLAVHLLNIGFDVLVQGVNATMSQTDWENLYDKGLYDIRFLTLGGITASLSAQVSNMIACAANRGDCIALVSLDETAALFDYNARNVNQAFASMGGSNGEYAAGFTPWFTSEQGDLIKATSTQASEGVYEWVESPEKIPAEFGYLFAYANSTKNNPEWYAIAGFERGIIPELKDVLYEYGSADVDVLQSRTTLDAQDDNVGVAVNPIANVRPAGYIIYGNRTLRNNDATKKTVAVSFLNVRNGVSAIKKTMYDAAKRYTFEQNTEILWLNFQSYITPLLDRMLTGNGLLGYRFIRQKTDAKARLKARLNIIPVEAVEDFDLEVYMTDDLTVVE